MPACAVLPTLDPTGHRTAITMLLYMAGLAIACRSCPYFTRMVDPPYAAAALCLDVLFLVPTVFAALTRRDEAMRMTFLVSIVYLPLLFVAMVGWRT